MRRLVDHGREGGDPSFFFREFAAPPGSAVDDEQAWAIANPALDDFLHRDALRATLPLSALRPRNGPLCPGVVAWATLCWEPGPRADGLSRGAGWTHPPIDLGRNAGGAAGVTKRTQSGPGGLRSPGPQPGPGWYTPTRSTGPMATHGRQPAIDLPRNANSAAGVTCNGRSHQGCESPLTAVEGDGLAG